MAVWCGKNHFEPAVKKTFYLLVNMNRRDFIRLAAAGTIGTGIPAPLYAAFRLVSKDNKQVIDDRHIKDYLNKIHNFDQEHNKDKLLSPEQKVTLKTSLMRLRRIQRTVGYGNFSLLSFDDAIKISKNYSRVGRFLKPELDFLEMLFYEEGNLYGFLGDKPLKNLTDTIDTPKALKIPYTGHYLYKGLPLELYNKIKKDVGDNVILTSGLRSVTKQFMLFLNKTYKNDGNLSLASRSLAPPGYSYHGVGDFDVGQVGFGASNFTQDFTDTKVYEKLADLGYIKLRYKEDNLLGVRFEPWHIKVNT
jgi:hypothetical protein